MEDVIKFKKYFDKFTSKDKNMMLKYHHSIRTMNVCKEIGKMMNLNSLDFELIAKIGLLHDIGRFNQLEEYYSFSDKNIDHADEGVKVLFDEDKIKNYNIEKVNYDVVRKAIRNHNKFTIEDGLNERELLFAKLIRDCDKLEILFRVGAEDLIIEEDDKEISLKVEEEFFNENLIKTEDVISENDKIICMLAYVYDINFKESFIYLKENELYENIYRIIRKNKRFKKYFDKVYQYIDLKIKEDYYVR